MNTHQPNREMLSAYLDGVLSPDALRSMEQHLGSCEVCSAALARERALLRTLDRLGDAVPPADFVAGVMGRVAQYPAHRPPAPIPWRDIARWGVAASVLVGAVGLAIVAWVFGSGLIGGSEALATVVGGGAGLIAGSVGFAREVATWAGVLLEQGGEMVWRLANLAVNSGWTVQIALLLVTVSLNYAFTRLVVNYQRRH